MRRLLAALVIPILALLIATVFAPTEPSVFADASGTALIEVEMTQVVHQAVEPAAEACRRSLEALPAPFAFAAKVWLKVVDRAHHALAVVGFSCGNCA